MRSQLTRSVFRRLLSNEGFLFSCPRQTVFVPRNRLRHVVARHGDASQRRTFLGFNSKPPRQEKDPHLTPGLMKMTDMSVMDRIAARPPPAKELVKAWKEFFKYKLAHKEPTNKYHAGMVLLTFKYLRDNGEIGGGGLTEKDIADAMKCLRLRPNDTLEVHNELARLMHAELTRRYPENIDQHILGYIHLLARTGDAMKGRELWDDYCATNKMPEVSEDAVVPSSPEKNKRIHTLLEILNGFAESDQTEELVRTVQKIHDYGLSYTRAVQKVMVKYFASRDDLAGVKSWLARPLEANGPQIPLPGTLETVLGFSIRNDELAWCKEVFRNVLSGKPDKLTWDVILQWAAGAMGKGVEDVDRMMDVMIQHNSDDPSIRPNVTTINGLISLAISLKDPYLAERYISLGLKRGIQPNARTMILQLEYRVDANDLVGAKAAYDALRVEEILNDSDLPAINKYIRALCVDHASNYNKISDITSELEERKKRLEPDTVSALCMVYLARNEIPDMIDLLQVQSYNYTIDERARIIAAFMAFIINRSNSTARVWDAYTVCRQIFDEMSVDLRTQCMNEFFRRERCDMACYCFGHMRQHKILYRRPKLETYVQCFIGIARSEDADSLYMVYNMLKLDVGIEPNTRLYNSLILAHTACGNADRALDFWDDITDSLEGPNYQSLEIVFDACGKKPYGDVKAREIWSKLRRMEVEITGEVFASYIGALAGQAKFEEARDLVDGMERELGLKCEMLTLVTFYNRALSQHRKDLVEAWAKEKYPAVWEEVAKLGVTQDENGQRHFYFKRDVMV